MELCTFLIDKKLRKFHPEIERLKKNMLPEENVRYLICDIESENMESGFKVKLRTDLNNISAVKN